MTYEVRFPNRVIAGRGSVARLSEVARDFGAERVCVVTSPALVAAGLYGRVADAPGAGVSCVSGVPDEPTTTDLRRVFDEVVANAPDMLVALGGGSVLDTAKLLSCMLTNAAFAQNPRDPSRIDRPAMPLCAVPTTAGTGAEATANAIVLVPEEKNKVGVIHARFLPPVVLLDPELTATLPPALTATTGVDALCHAIESYWSRRNNPFSEQFALAAVERLARGIERAFRDGADMDARADMQLGAFYAGVCLTSSTTTAVHALSYPLGGTFRVPHGLANAMLLPYVLRVNLPDAREKLARLAPFFGAASPEGMADAVNALMARLGIPASLRAVGVDETHVDDLVRGALQVTRLLDQNPRALDAAQVRAIYMNML